MAIQKLEDNTVRLLGASQVLNDPSALVKELVDNALDARATSIAIEISANTLDVIQVRDNGHGITPEDRAMAARPNCTSKLAVFDDLRAIGGSTLGFRGQALAAAAELSGGMTISTRVEGEEVAVTMTINRLGEIASQQRTSLPIGSTVRVEDFVQSQPVRRQQALKNAEKTLRHVKQTLQAYAFARPHVRLSLRVLRAKNDKGNWMYAPKPDAAAEDAAIKIMGSACVMQCEWIVLEEEGYAIRALVPRPDAEVSKVVNSGSFVSIDGRPVSTTRGTMKQVIKIFREALKAAGSKWSGAKDPFINLLITCPAASYDPNVEPSKDDVLFEDQDVVIRIARKLFATLYSLSDSMAADQHTNQAPSPRRLSLNVHDDVVTSTQEPSHEPQSPLTPGMSEFSHRTDVSAGVAPRQAFRRNMYGCDEEDVDLMDARPRTGRTEAECEELRQARKDVTLSNPWVTAKMNATRKETVDGDQSIPDFVLATSPVKTWTGANVVGHGLPTPRPSSPSPDANTPHHLVLSAEMGGSGDPRSLARLQNLHDTTPINTPFLPSTGPKPDLSGRPGQYEAPAYDYGLATTSPSTEQGTPLQAIPFSNRRPRQRPNKPYTGSSPTKRPFITPVTERTPREKVWFDHLENSGASHHRNARRRAPVDDASLVRQGELGDLLDEPRPLTPPRRNKDIRAWVGSIDRATNDVASVVESRSYGQLQHTRSASHMDETLQENAAPKPVYHGFVPASDLAVLEAHAEQIDEAAVPRPKRQKSGGTRSRALRDLSTNIPLDVGQDEHAKMQAVTDTDQDIEKAASKRRRTTDGTIGKVQRTKSARLPLERIPRGHAMHNLEVKTQISARQISCWAGRLDEDAALLGWNEPAAEPRSALAEPMGEDAMHDLSQMLQRLLVDRVSDGEMVQDLEGLVATALRSRDECE